MSKLFRAPGPHVLMNNVFSYQLVLSNQKRTILTAKLFNSHAVMKSLYPVTSNVQVQQVRYITVISRLGKRKSCKSVLKRFRRVKGGLLKRWRAGMVHKQRKKSSWRRFRLRGSVLVKNKTQLRTLNKMMYKH